MSAAAKNLEVIHKAIVRHNGNCPGQIIAIKMNPFECERLDFDSFNGIPIEPDEKIGTGRFSLICDEENSAPTIVDATADQEVKV